MLIPHLLFIAFLNPPTTSPAPEDPASITINALFFTPAILQESSWIPTGSGAGTLHLRDGAESGSERYEGFCRPRDDEPTPGRVTQHVDNEFARGDVFKVRLREDKSLGLVADATFTHDDRIRKENITIKNSFPVDAVFGSVFAFPSDDLKHIVVYRITREKHAKSSSPIAAATMGNDIQAFNLCAALIRLDDDSVEKRDEGKSPFSRLVADANPVELTRWLQIKVKLKTGGDSGATAVQIPLAPDDVTVDKRYREAGIRFTTRSSEYPATINVDVVQRLEEIEEFHFSGTIKIEKEQVGPIVRSADGKYLLLFKWKSAG